MALIETERESRGGRDTALRDWVRALEATAPIAGEPQRTLACFIEEIARERPDAPALLSAAETFSYGTLAARINRYARWALAQDLGNGDVVGLMMPNRPEYLAIWLGLTSVGVVVALLNTNLRGPALAHCIDTVAPKHVIVAAELGDAFQSAADAVTCQPNIWLYGDAGRGDDGRIDLAVDSLSADPLGAERRAVTIADPALLIYTSGTTGLPKAAYVSHRRVLEWSFWFAGLMDTGPDDRMYDCLPLYHSVGGVVATGAVLVRGGSVLIRDKFSAQRFWDDLADGGCTLVQYIGELCRYLVNAPPHPRERAHRLRLACGNGLQADIWEKFQQKFAIPRILEFYAATEGNFSLYNVEGKVGAIGRVPSFLAHRFPLRLVRLDAVTTAPARDERGFCIRCGANEIGEAIGKIHDGAAHGGTFEGYTDAAASDRKILRNVFEPGDAWYRTGDLMRRDAGGFFYFVDRIGDTFRWKGENVSTSEVAAAITAFPGIVEAAVYGVHIPGTEGAAGMAAIVCEGPLDLAAFRVHLVRCLPAYARPLFVRVMAKIAVTGTFKHTKSNLQREGYDPAASDDGIYFDHPVRHEFVRLDGALYGSIQAGKVRL
jgi:fatty-acyl-CoA synthase